MDSEDPVLSFVVIGYNEAPALEACFRSVKAAKPDGMPCEIIYADGGSTDGSREIAHAAGIDAVLGGDRQRRAAENRNLGLQEARGEYIQFVDGDMELDPEWPRVSIALLEKEPAAAAVFGVLRERNQGPFYRAMQIDWEYPEGTALYCGGAAMFRRAPLAELGGFPEDVAYGEEPYLCWRIRNELGMRIHHLHHRMAGHDLDYQGLGDYWRRTVRCGETYAEIAARCRGSQDPFWSDAVRGNVRWAILIALWLAAVLVLPTPVRLVLAGLALGLLGRKAWQFRQRGWDVAALYAVHTYAAKVAIAQGILRWKLRRR